MKFRNFAQSGRWTSTGSGRLPLGPPHRGSSTAGATTGVAARNHPLFGLDMPAPPTAGQHQVSFATMPERDSASRKGGGETQGLGSALLRAVAARSAAGQHGHVPPQRHRVRGLGICRGESPQRMLGVRVALPLPRRESLGRDLRTRNIGSGMPAHRTLEQGVATGRARGGQSGHRAAVACPDYLFTYLGRSFLGTASGTGSCSSWSWSS